MTVIANFAEHAAALRAWARSAPADAATEAVQVRRLIASLYAAALALPAVPFGQFGVVQPGDDAWREVYRRGGVLPFNYYSQADPLEVPTDAVTIGDLADDVADIWRDVMAGLSLYEDGRIDDAATEWRARFDSHWGQHAADALMALQAWHQRAHELLP